MRELENWSRLFDWGFQAGDLENIIANIIRMSD